MKNVKRSKLESSSICGGSRFILRLHTNLVPSLADDQIGKRDKSVRTCVNGSPQGCKTSDVEIAAGRPLENVPNLNELFGLVEQCPDLLSISCGKAKAPIVLKFPIDLSRLRGLSFSAHGVSHGGQTKEHWALVR
jgi:hypothetical protein